MARTVKLNRKRLIEGRIRMGWTQHELSVHTDSVVRKLAEEEIAANERGVFARRVALHDRHMLLAGLPVNTISNAERGKNVYLITARILSKTLKIPLEELCEMDVQPDPAGA